MKSNTVPTPTTLFRLLSTPHLLVWSEGQKRFSGKPHFSEREACKVVLHFHFYGRYRCLDRDFGDTAA